MCRIDSNTKQTIEHLTKKPLNKDGFRYHLKYGYPAFKSLTKYNEDSREILEYIKNEKSNGALNLLVFCAKNCPYMVQYVQMPFEKENVENYWKGNSNKSHNSIKFRDWIIDDVLDYKEPREVRLSKKCDINELNNCLIIPAKIINVQNEKIEVSYIEYKSKNNVLNFQEKISEIFSEFIENPKVGDYVIKHHDYAVEKINQDEKNKIITHLENLAEAYNNKNLKNLIPLSDKILDKLK